MKVIRYDRVGTVQIRLLRRPTNTAAGVDNFHVCANGFPEWTGTPLVRFLGTDPYVAHDRYDRAVLAAEAIVEAAIESR